MNDLWQKINYRAPVQYIIDMTIREFDITKANISVLRDANAITEELYQYLYRAPKQERSVYIGKLEGKHPEIVPVLKSGIEKARRTFIETNGIETNEVLAIRNDAIMVIGDRPISNLQMTDRVAFRLAAAYRSFYKLDYMDFFYNYDLITRTEVLDIKGLNNESIELHKQFMLDFLAELFYTAQIEDCKGAISILNNFYKQFINKELDIGFYRELNSQSQFRFINSMTSVGRLYSDNCSNYDKKYIDLSCNANILRQLNRMYSRVYFNKR